MKPEEKRKLLKEEMKRTGGILRLAPCWVTRTTLPAGRRMKLDVRDLYPRGLKAGPVCERWFASTGMADNGETTGPDEGLSFIVCRTENGVEKIQLREAVELIGDEILGEKIMKERGKMTFFAKFYDFSVPINHHVHLMEEQAALVGVAQKPEAYYYPIELNAYEYKAGYTYFGLDPHLTKKELKAYLEKWDCEDNGILELSRAYKLKLGTGWDVPAGILHAPGSLVTYEPQYMSDCSIFMQNLNNDLAADDFMLWDKVPADKKGDWDYLISCLDWEANTDLDFKEHHYHEPVPAGDVGAMEEKGYYEEWIVYGSKEFCAKRLVVKPGASVTIRDEEAYGFIMMQGNGTIDGLPIETPACIRYEQLTCDEYFVSEPAATRGVTIANPSDNADIVMLKHFGYPGKQF